MRKITIKASEKELDAIEDLLTIWNLCETHKRDVMILDDRMLNRVQYDCPDCQEKIKELRKHSLKLWSRICSAYYGEKKSRLPAWIRHGTTAVEKFRERK